MKARQQSGFTLIELVMVIVILGILSAVAIPQFVNLQSDARQGATDGIAGALGSASAINVAACQIAGGTACNNAIANCTDVDALLQGGALPGAPDYTITAAALIVAGTTCTITHNSDASASSTFVGHRTAP